MWCPESAIGYGSLIFRVLATAAFEPVAAELPIIESS
jgi:hypothetical protein